MNAMVLNRMALKSKDRKGFTLVEVIVVLVIIAILMAIAVPALTGYIAKTKNTGAQIEAHSVLVSLQAYATEHEIIDDTITGDPLATVATEIGTLMGKSVTATAKTDSALLGNVVIDDTGTVESFTYTTSAGKEVSYSATTGEMKVKDVNAPTTSG
jgi:prepilin-type N-terminal cleavage/methylation domain-containing protein